MLECHFSDSEILIKSTVDKHEMLRNKNKQLECNITGQTVNIIMFAMYDATRDPQSSSVYSVKVRQAMSSESDDVKVNQFKNLKISCMCSA